MDLLNHLAQPQALIGVVILLAFFVFMAKARKKPGIEPLDYDYSYEYVAEPIDTANKEFLKTFKGMLPEPGSDADTTGVHLIRFAVMNRGRLRIEEKDHTRPLVVHFPEEAEILDIRYDGHHGYKPDDPPQPIVHPNGFELPPFVLPTATAFVYNIVLRNADAPKLVDAGIEGQAAIKRLT